MGLTEQLAAWQQVGPDQPPSDVIVHWLPASPPQLLVPEHELGWQTTCELADWVVTLPEQQLSPQFTMQLVVAVQSIGPLHELETQLMEQSVPAHCTPPEHELSPQFTWVVAPVVTTPPEQPLLGHSMSQLAALQVI